MIVLIKGMKMPTTCDECDFCHWSNIHQTGICDRCGDEPVCPDYGTDYKMTRARFCPLIELPEKHGRLIDERVAYDKIAEQEGGYYMDMDGVGCGLEETPTVFEAEGDDE